MKTKISFIFVFLLFGKTFAFSQTSEKLTSWVDYWREATVSIGKIAEVEIKQENNTVSTKKIFDIIGTGVVFNSPNDHNKLYLVTAKHIFLNSQNNESLDKIRLRFSWNDNKVLDEYLGISLQLKENGENKWIAHPDENVDLACIELSISQDEIGDRKISYVPIKNFATDEDAYEGASVFVLGYPGALGVNFLSRAIIRQGIISWISPFGLDSGQVLIDCNVFPGNSGGPVFITPNGTDRDGGVTIGRKIQFLGIVSRGAKQYYKTYAEDEPLIIKDQEGRQLNVYTYSYMGIGVIEPAHRVKELLTEAEK